jgi:hypothetical protein
LQQFDRACREFLDKKPEKGTPLRASQVAKAIVGDPELSNWKLDGS